jgi:hypothetical protein
MAVSNRPGLRRYHHIGVGQWKTRASISLQTNLIHSIFRLFQRVFHRLPVFLKVEEKAAADGSRHVGDDPAAVFGKLALDDDRGAMDEVDEA